nr:MAG TPA: hypothetical protein [Caudoviricetes sp.]
MVINVDGTKINSCHPISHGFCFHFCYLIVSFSLHGKQKPYYLTHNCGGLFSVSA